MRRGADRGAGIRNAAQRDDAERENDEVGGEKRKTTHDASFDWHCYQRESNRGAMRIVAPSVTANRPEIKGNFVRGRALCHATLSVIWHLVPAGGIAGSCSHAACSGTRWRYS